MKKNRMMMAAGVVLVGCSAPMRGPKPECAAETQGAKASARASAPEEDGLLLLVLPERRAGETEAKQEAGVLRLGPGAPVAQLAPQATRIKAKVFGPAAQVTVSQVFRNTTGQTVDAAWLLPVPAAAVVMELTVDIGARHFRAVTVEEAQAEKLYAAAVAQGRHAAMVKAEDAGWRLRLGQVRAGEKVGTGVVYGEMLRLYEQVRLPSAGPWSVTMDYANEKFGKHHTCQGEGAGKVHYFPNAYFGGGNDMDILIAVNERRFSGEEFIDSGMDGNGVSYLLKGRIREEEKWDKRVDAPDYGFYDALLAGDQMRQWAYEDRAAAHPTHTQEILDLARLHKIVCPGLSLLMVDAKK